MYKDKDPSKYKDTSLKHKAGKIAGAAAVATSLFFGGLDTEAALAHHSAPVTLNAKDIEFDAVQATTQENQAKGEAISIANSYAEAFNDGDNIANVPILNGTIDVLEGGAYKPSYKNPILLTAGTSAVPNKSGNFLEGAWLGVQGNDAKGNVTITPVPFDESTDRFTAFKSGKVLLQNVGVDAFDTTEKKTVNGSSVHLRELTAYDLDSHLVSMNSDGSEVHPGYSDGMK